VGIVNATPDSFTDEGAHHGTERAVAHGVRLAAQGADVVEVGGASLRFGPPVDPAVEIARVRPVIAALAERVAIPVSVDTYKPEVARAAIAAGASILNDPTGLRDPAMREVAAETGVGVIAAHFAGMPNVRPPHFPDIDVPAAVLAWGRRTLRVAAADGIPPGRIVIDPGVGLGKSPPQDLDLLHRLDELGPLGRPLLIPISNKKVIGAVTGAPAKRRLAGTVAGLVWCRTRGATLFRVHNVKFLRGALEMADALAEGRPARWHEVVK
jgi:dihydropteroate synthase